MVCRVVTTKKNLTEYTVRELSGFTYGKGKYLLYGLLILTGVVLTGMKLPGAMPGQKQSDSKSDLHPALPARKCL